MGWYGAGMVPFGCGFDAAAGTAMDLGDLIPENPSTKTTVPFCLSFHAYDPRPPFFLGRLIWYDGITRQTGAETPEKFEFSQEGHCPSIWEISVAYNVPLKRLPTFRPKLTGTRAKFPLSDAFAPEEKVRTIVGTGNQ